jgi:hypothetical protein
VHAGARQHGGLYIRVLTFDEGQNFVPQDGASHVSLILPGNRRVVFHTAGCGAALAGKAFVKVNYHSPAGHRLPPEFVSQTG